MDFNVVVLAGTLTAQPEIRRYASGSYSVRCLITVRTESPRRRVDVVPVTLWNPPVDHAVLQAQAADSVWAAGAVQRRFWEDAGQRRSKLEVVASQIEIGTDLEVGRGAAAARLLTE